MQSLQKINRPVKVSVHMPAYNHERYIAEALDSALMQRTDFNYEIVIGDDCSTDNTKVIALEYVERFPEKIRLLAHEKNIGIWANDRAITQACRGEYIACFHWAKRLSDSAKPVTWKNGPPETKPFYSLDDLLENGHFVPSCTAVFRRDLIREPLEWARNTPFLETTYFVRFALSGKLGFLDEEMAVFRYHSDGIYGKATNVQNIQSAINTHILVGKNFNLEGLGSYQRGLARMQRNLSHEIQLLQ